MRQLTYKNEKGDLFTFEDILDFFDTLIVKPGPFIKMIYSPNQRLILIHKHERSYVFNEVE